MARLTDAMAPIRVRLSPTLRLWMALVDRRAAVAFGAGVAVGVFALGLAEWKGWIR